LTRQTVVGQPAIQYQEFRCPKVVEDGSVCNAPEHIIQIRCPCLALNHNGTHVFDGSRFIGNTEHNGDLQPQPPWRDLWYSFLLFPWQWREHPSCSKFI